MNNNNNRLKQILSTNQLTHKSVAIMLDVSTSCVNSWSIGDRNVPDSKIKYLELLIKLKEVKL